jgi:RNA polymerase sigma-70 factor (ECF subfamily)
MSRRETEREPPPRFQQLYDEFHPRILRYLARMAGTTDAEDLTQEVFAKVDQALPSFRGDSKVSTWIYRIATNAAIERLRRREPDRPAPDAGGADAAVDHAPAADRTLVRDEMQDCIRAYIADLPPSYRSVLILSEYEELTDQQIADVLGLTVGTVKIRLHRARRRLRDALGSGCAFYRDDRNELACEPAYPPRPIVRL